MDLYTLSRSSRGVNACELKTHSPLNNGALLLCENLFAPLDLAGNDPATSALQEQRSPKIELQAHSLHDIIFQNFDLSRCDSIFSGGHNITY